MAAISRITIDGFKAFPNSFTLNLEGGKNLLMYGENGSGKSSIFYALHSILQSQCGKDKNNVYFDINAPESLVNQYTKKTDAKVEIQFEGSDVSYKISHNGYDESVHQAISPLRDMNGKCVFINHKFLFNVFSFRNSQYIDLFPVFIKDILPFTLTRNQSQYISELYEEIMAGIGQKKKRTANTYSDKIRVFNEELQEVIRKINESGVPAASELYNKFFRNEDEPELRIKLVYDNNIDPIPQPGKSYWLRLGYRFKDVFVANVHKTERLSHRKELLPPVITLSIEEKQDDDNYTSIKKPQTYFNEAKLTAIALAIRFSMLDTLAQEDGRFIALDDMLISLDMSNRMKVIDYLLQEVLGKYKIYLFTHDRLFYSTLKKRIEIEKKREDWLIGGIFMHNVDENNNFAPCVPFPLFIEDKEKELLAREYYAMHDYPACGQVLRKWCEEIFEKLYPDTLKKGIDSRTHQTGVFNLNDRITNLSKYCEKEGLNFQEYKNIKIYKDNILNSVSHYDVESPIYKEEILQIMKVLKKLDKLIQDRVYIQVNHGIGLELVKQDGTPVTVCISIRGSKNLQILYIDGAYRLSYFINCSVKKVIDNGVNMDLPEEKIYDSIYDIYNEYCRNLGIPNTDNLLDVLQDHNTILRDKLNSIIGL